MPYGTDSDGHLTASLEQALALALRNPGEGATWDRAEALAEGRAESRAVAEAYRKALSEDHPRAPWVLELGERAVHFHREWCAEEPESLILVLERLLALEPEADWALRQLIVVLTLREDWDRLLANYDRALAAAAEKSRRAELLGEAAQIAKDFLGSPERAVSYLRPLFAIRTQDAQVVAALERLLEKLERWAELVEVWSIRLGELPADEAAALRVKIADVLHERLRSHRSALEALASLRGQRRHLALAVARLGALVGDARAPAEVRRDAVRWLADHHDEVASPDDALAVVLEGLGFVAGADRVALLGEAARRFVAAGREPEAAHQLASLLPLVPSDRAVEDELFRLATRTGLQRLAVRGLLDAATSAADGRERVRLLLRAAAELESALRETDEAVALYERVTQDDAASVADRIHAYGRLEAIWELTDKPELRLGALTALVGLVERPSERRAWLGVAAKLAFSLEDWDRAVGLWRRILEGAGTDREALDGQVAALTAAGRFRELSAALRQRSTASVDPREQAADLARAAEVEARDRKELAAADDLWRERDERFGPTEEGVDARVTLLTQTGRVKELVAVLEKDTARERARGDGRGSAR